MKKLFALTTIVAFAFLYAPFVLQRVEASSSCTFHDTTIVSDTTNTVVGDGNAVAVTPHAAWTASIPGSTTWIWKSSATAVNETVAFEKGFTVIGTVLSAQLDIASDNSYKVFVDNVQVAADASAINFTLATQDVHNLTTVVTPGTHTLRIEVKNHGTFNTLSNPAGLLYKLVVESKTCEGDDTVKNKNKAKVVNVVESSANTGGNSADGGYAGGAGNGGNVTNSEDDNTGGDGGNAGNGGNGGAIVTGDAVSTGSVFNQVNTNITRIDRCACGGGGDGDVKVKNKNRAKVSNFVYSDANSGLNDADGDGAGSGGDGGDVVHSDDGNAGGNGGNGGNGGLGGIIGTGNATAVSAVANFINTNLTRIRR